MEERLATYAKERDNLDTPSTLTAGYVLSNMGTDLDAIEPFTVELTGIVDKMKEELANEMRILEGTDVPEYTQNELSEGETKEGQWTTDLPSGFSTIVLTPISTRGSSSLPCSVRHNSPVSPTLGCAGKFCERSTGSSWVMSDGCGCVTDAMNESSECTVPTISEPTPGTPSEVK
jgi:hypothetical protein